MHVSVMRKFANFALCLIVFAVGGEFQSLRRRYPTGRKVDHTFFVDAVGKTEYSAEEHDVTTADGYILTLHRISGGPLSPPARGKPVVILIHGLLASSDFWVILGPGKDLVYLLADEGYDVWCLNPRGNAYSRHHVLLSPERPEFWRFSWHEFGVYDMPATIDYVLALTGLNKVSLIGHSIGTCVSYVLLSERSDYNEKVDVVVSLSPVPIFTHNLSGILGIAVNYSPFIERVLKDSGTYELLRLGGLNEWLHSFCSIPANKKICLYVFNDIFGSSDDDGYYSALIPTLIRYFPAGTSVDTVTHIRRNVQSRKFNRFDYGPMGNLDHYGNLTPPEYELNRVTVPIVLYYGLGDPFSTRSDARVLEKRLPNAISREIPAAKFNHADFLFSKNSKKLLYDDIIKVLNKYNR